MSQCMPIARCFYRGHSIIMRWARTRFVWWESTFISANNGARGKRAFGTYRTPMFVPPIPTHKGWLKASKAPCIPLPLYPMMSPMFDVQWPCPSIFFLFFSLSFLAWRNLIVAKEARTNSWYIDAWKGSRHWSPTAPRAWWMPGELPD